MSAAGKKRKCPGSRGTSVLPSGADIVSLPRHVHFVPKGEILSPSTCFPLHLRQRTCCGCTAMTVSCQQRTHVPQQRQRGTNTLRERAPTAPAGHQNQTMLAATGRAHNTSTRHSIC